MNSALSNQKTTNFLMNVLLALALLLVLPIAKADETVWRISNIDQSYIRTGSSPFELCDDYLSHLNATIFSSPLVDKYVKASSSWDNDAVIACNGDPLADPSVLDGIVKTLLTSGGYIFSHSCVPRYTNLERSLVGSRCDEYYLSRGLLASVGLSGYSCQHGLNLTTGKCNSSDSGGNNSSNANNLKNIGSCESVGNPINPNIGNKFQVETDFAGAGLFPLTLTRTYIVKCSKLY